MDIEYSFVVVDGELYLQHGDEFEFAIFYKIMDIILNTHDERALEMIQDIEIVPLEEVFDVKPDTKH